MLFRSETFDRLRGFWSGFLRFAKRATKMEGHFSSLRENRAIGRLQGFLDRMMRKLVEARIAESKTASERLLPPHCP
jgi:hypothetical protein